MLPPFEGQKTKSHKSELNAKICTHLDDIYVGFYSVNTMESILSVSTGSEGVREARTPRVNSYIMGTCFTDVHWHAHTFAMHEPALHTQ